MKTLYLIVSISFLFFTCSAQALLPRFGVTNTANTQQVSSGSMRSKTAFTAGIGYLHKLGDKLAAQLELNYIQKAFQFKQLQETSQVIGTDLYFYRDNRTDRYKIAYLEIPLLIRLKLFHENFFVAAGPSFGFGIGGSYHHKSDVTASYFDPTITTFSRKIKFGDKPSENSDDVYIDNAFDAGFQAGAGFILFKKVQAELRYGVGLTDLYKDFRSKNRSLQVSLAVPIQLGKK